jgi:cysteine desulfuration protein SufE|tara:strand:+ start:246 stop:641 length:396 start_codon:yes stop_codon:yes gene_type:complete
MKIEEWAENLSMMGDGTERLTYLVELARNKTTLPYELRSDDRLIGGCLSKIWVEVGVVDEQVQVYYDSDAMITKGITSIVCDCFSNQSIADAKKITEEDFQKLGIQQLITPQRRNGLSSLIGTIISKIQRL